MDVITCNLQKKAMPTVVGKRASKKTARVMKKKSVFDDIEIMQTLDNLGLSQEKKITMNTLGHVTRALDAEVEWQRIHGIW